MSATITKGQTFGATELVTNTKLHNLVDSATISGIAVTELATGTDGELITWDAAGAAATVAVGTATHVLTSNGVGVAPTFQASPAETDTLASVTGRGATTSTDVSLNGQIIFQTDKYVVCDTFTSAGINACIDALGAEGGEVYLPEGDYDCTTVITIDADNTTLRGAGKGTRLLATNRFVYTTVTGTPAAGETIMGDTNSYTATVVQVDTTNKIVWYHSISNAANYTSTEVISWSGGADTTINGVAPTEQDFVVIDPVQTDYCTISDLSIVGGSGGNNGTSLIGSNNAAPHLTVRNCWLSESDDKMIYGNANHYTKIINNYFEESDRDCIQLGAANFILVEGNTFDKIKTNLAINCAGTYARVVDNTFIASASIYAGIGAVIANNNFKDAVVSPIYVIGEKAVVVGNTIIDTVSGQKDIFIENGDGCLVVGNVCDGSGTSDRGIYLDEADNCIVVGNITSGHDIAGIQEDSDCQNNIIAGNNCQDTVPYILNGTAAEPFNIGQSAIVSKPDPITATSEGVAASVTTLNTEVTTNGDSDLDNVTLANGTSGQVKHIYCVAEGNAADTWKITPATMCGGTQITFAGIGEGCTLVYADSEGWVVTANNGGTIS